MKKALLLLLALILSASICLVSCGNKTGDGTGDNNQNDGEISGDNKPDDNNPGGDDYIDDDNIDNEFCSHVFGDWVIDVQPTATENGSQHRECTLCSEREEEVLYATGTQGLNYEVNADGKTCVIKRTTTLKDSQLVIPKQINGYTVVGIADGAFNYLSVITSVTIPDTVTSIGSGVFSSCSKLESVALGSGLVSIGDSAFSSCTSLTSIVIPDSVTEIGEGAFSGCKLLSSVNLSNRLTVLKKNVFSNCTSLASIEFPNSIEVIGTYAFYSCTALASIEIPDTVKTVEGSAFSGCSALQSVSIGNGLSFIGTNAFYDCNNIAFTEYENCKYLGNESNPYLILYSVINRSTKTCTINKDTKIIYHSAFSLAEINTVEIPDGVIYIGNKAFDGCYRLATVFISKSVNAIGDSPFSRCQTLTSIEVDSANESFTSINGSLYTKDGQTLIHSVN